MFERMGAETKPSPEAQFENPETLMLGGGKVEVYDITPEEQADPVPTYFGLGWSTTTETYKRNILSLAENKRRVISANTPHGIDYEAKEGEENYAAAELRKVAAIMETLDAKGIAQVDAVAHSESGIYLTIAATLYPERFRSLTLVDPAGIVGEDNMARLAVGFSKDVVGQTVKDIREKPGPDHVKPDFLSALKVITGNPLRSIKEVFAIANSDIRAMLVDLKEKGVGINLIHCVDDAMFPMEKVQEAIDTSHVDGVYSIHGMHNEVILNPDPVTKVIDHSIRALAKKLEATVSEEKAA
jgi:pimeloyl-ACP methyl ester carboxylesterase